MVESLSTSIMMWKAWGLVLWYDARHRLFIYLIITFWKLTKQTVHDFWTFLRFKLHLHPKRGDIFFSNLSNRKHYSVCATFLLFKYG